MRFTCGLFVLVVLGWMSVKEAPGRTWTDKKGKEIEAELIEVKAGVAHLKLDNGKIVKKPVAALSQEDQDFIKESADAQDPAPMPKKPASKKPAPKKPSSTEPDSKQPTQPARPVRAATGGVTVEVVGISIGKPLPEDPAAEQGAFMPMAGQGQSGTKFVLSLTDPERQIVSLDHDKSKITACTDDSGGNLNKADGGRSSGFSPFPLQLRSGRHFGLVEVSQPLAPSPGATKIHLQGELVLQCGVGEKTADQADVPLTSVGQITVGPVPFKIGPGDKQAGFQLALPFKIEGADPQEGGEPKVVVTLSTNKPIEIIKKIVFLNAAGKEIAQQELGSSTSGFAGNVTHERTIGLTEAVEKATVRIVSYEKLESISVPIDFEIGVGF